MICFLELLKSIIHKQSAMKLTASAINGWEVISPTSTISSNRWIETTLKAESEPAFSVIHYQPTSLKPEGTFYSKTAVYTLRATSMQSPSG